MQSFDFIWIQLQILSYRNESSINKGQRVPEVERDRGISFAQRSSSSIDFALSLHDSSSLRHHMGIHDVTSYELR